MTLLVSLALSVKSALGAEDEHEASASLLYVDTGIVACRAFV